MYNDDKKIKKSRSSHKRKKTYFFQEIDSKDHQITNHIEKIFSHIMWQEILYSLTFIIIGIFFYFYSNASTILIGIILGILFILKGLTKIRNYSQKRQIPLFSFSLYFGIISLLLGILTILNPFLFTKLATMMIGFYLIYNTVVKIDLSLRLKAIKEQSWFYLFISAILSLFMGIILLINPFNNLILTEIIGSFLILYGVLNAADAYLVKKRATHFLKRL